MRKFLVLLAVSVSSLSYAKDSPIQKPSSFELSCPAPENISITQVPYSFHTVYTAESQGIGFSGMDLSVIEPAGSEFFYAEVSQVNDYWRLYCMYHDGDLRLILATNDSAIYKTCHFEGERQQCEGSLDKCVLSCPERPE